MSTFSLALLHGIGLFHTQLTDGDCTLDDRAYKVYTDKVTWIKYLWGILADTGEHGVIPTRTLPAKANRLWTDRQTDRSTVQLAEHCQLQLFTWEMTWDVTWNGRWSTLWAIKHETRLF